MCTHEKDMYFRKSNKQLQLVSHELKLFDKKKQKSSPNNHKNIDVEFL